MILWNTSNVIIETKFDGKAQIFAPNERKEVFDPVIVNHLIYKLEDYGLVSMPDGTKPEDEQKFLIEGVRKRRGMLDGRVRNFRTMNKEREAAKLSPEPPSQIIIDSVNEIEAIDEKLKTLLASDYAKVDAYMKTHEAEETQEKMEGQTSSVEVTATKVTVKKGGPKHAVPSSKHT